MLLICITGRGTDLSYISEYKTAQISIISAFWFMKSIKDECWKEHVCHLLKKAKTIECGRHMNRQMDTQMILTCPPTIAGNAKTKIKTKKPKTTLDKGNCNIPKIYFLSYACTHTYIEEYKTLANVSPNWFIELQAIMFSPQLRPCPLNLDWITSHVL